MNGNDWLLTSARWLLRVVLWANWVIAIGFVAVLLLTVPFHAPIEARLIGKYGAGLDVWQTMLAARVLLLIGVAACAVAWVIATRLLAMIATVAGGTPFAAANAKRLATLGWALLAWQLLDLAIGATTGWVTTLGVEFSTWTPSVGGWVAVLLAFILARIFAHGAAINEELEGTI